MMCLGGTLLPALAGLLFALPRVARAQSPTGVPLFGQCGGLGYTGPTECANPDFPQVLIECKPINAELSQCLDISDPNCGKVACKCALGYVTKWYTGPPPMNCRLCTCVPDTKTSSTLTKKPPATLITVAPTTLTTSNTIYPYYPPPPIYSSSCTKATNCPTCRSPAASVSFPESVITPGTSTQCEQCYCLCPIFDCFCRPPAVYLPSTYGNCLACTCSTPTQTLVQPSDVPGPVKPLEEDLSVTVTAFLEPQDMVQAKPTEAAEAGTSWRRRIAMPEVTAN
ncbi:hypothetical protein CC1G_07631 [Coprinopsis cinerea okayama7|uniref:CBM1 domain-containing protein n=1 Tax=Coprinopsis cinerea (strain Okayama-7 / 130 / ATCC MYA-4618 / FGSC 9003) TaxID=240176 RepID=A8NC27_COPC7|nr:hypothetical protein CC1G_07631 [Coprinopsis cinerea okayama7\|eukprot:XP_001832371.1 hypothetical protein CC1G_07631 [Coprinopsis cinerea okayama7\